MRSIQTETYDLIREIKRVSLQTNTKIIYAKVRREVMEWIAMEEQELFGLLNSQFGIEVKLIQSEFTIASLREAAYEVWT